MPMFMLPGIRRPQTPELDEMAQMLMQYQQSKRNREMEPQQGTPQPPKPPSAPQGPSEPRSSFGRDTLASGSSEATETPRMPYKGAGQDVDTFVSARTVTPEQVRAKGRVKITNQARSEGLSYEAKQKADQINKYFNNKVYALDAKLGMGAMSQEEFDLQRADIEKTRSEQLARIEADDRVRVNRQRTVTTADDQEPLPGNEPAGVGPRYHGEEPRARQDYQEDLFGPVEQETVRLQENDVYNKATGEIQTPEEAEKWGFSRAAEANDRAVARGARPIYSETSQRMRDTEAAQMAAENPYGLAAVPIPQAGEDPRAYAARVERWKQTLAMQMGEAKTAQELATITQKALAEVAKLQQVGANDMNVENIRAAARVEVARLAAEAKKNLVAQPKTTTEKPTVDPAVQRETQIREKLRPQYAEYIRRWNEPAPANITSDMFAKVPDIVQSLKEALASDKTSGRNPARTLAIFRAKYGSKMESVMADLGNDPDMRALMTGKQMTYDEWLEASGNAQAYEIGRHAPQPQYPPTTAEVATGAYEKAAGNAPPPQPAEPVAPVQPDASVEDDDLSGLTPEEREAFERFYKMFGDLEDLMDEGDDLLGD